MKTADERTQSNTDELGAWDGGWEVGVLCPLAERQMRTRERVRALTRVASRATEKGLSITPATAATRWRGEEMDYDLAIFLLWDKAQREMTAAAAGYPSLHVSAETPAVDRV